MVKGDIWHEIHSRHMLKESKKSIARALGLDVRTVRRAGLAAFPLRIVQEEPLRS